MTDATWKLHPANHDFDNPNNWSTAAVPQDADTAFFGPSSITSLTFSGDTDIGGWSFKANAANYTFTLAGSRTLNFEAAGLTGKSASAHIVNDGHLGFFNESKAGHAHILNNLYFSFNDDSSADHATINAKHEIDFFDDSSAGNAKITNNSFLSFNGNSSADHATITTTANHVVSFFDTSDGDFASFITEKGGYVDFTPSTGHGGLGIHSAGSIAGTGAYIFNSVFFVGGNNRSTKVSGLITDNNTGGELVKFGTGTLTLANGHNHFSSAEIGAGILDIAARSAGGLGEITFAPPSSANETLKIENAALSHRDFNTNQIVDFGLAHEAIDLAGLKFAAGAKATLDGNVLTVKSGRVKDTLTLVSAQTSQFKAVNDGHGGTKVIAKVTMEKPSLVVPEAAWKQHPVNHDFDNPANWSTAAVPVSGETALFGPSRIASISFSTSNTVGGWTFKANAANYTFTLAQGKVLDFDAAGLTGKTASAHIVNNGQIDFYNSSVAGHAHITNMLFLDFFDGSSADHATINAKAEIDLYDNATFGNAKIANNAYLSFNGSSSAGHATITTASNHNIIFYGNSDGGLASFVTKAGGDVDFSQDTGPGRMHVHNAGSIAGGGEYIFSGVFNVGANNHSTKASGPITDNGSGGLLVKTGTGTLTLAHQDNDYGSTQISQGTLDLAARSAAGTGAINFLIHMDGVHETLKIENAALSGRALANEIVNFGAAGEAIDLAGLKFVAGAKATLSGNTLTVKSGHVTDTLTLTSPLATEFVARNDGHGGTKVVVAPPHERPTGEHVDVADAVFHLDAGDTAPPPDGLLL